MRFCFLLRIGALTGIIACTGGEPLLSPDDEIAVTMMLSRGPTSADSALYALVFDARSSGVNSYRAVEQVEMRRRSDGALFAWQVVPRGGTIPMPVQATVSTDVSNLRLPWRGTGGLLGREDLASGETYDLILVTAGVTITGSTSLPAAPAPVAEAGDPLAFSWTSTEFAAAYAVKTDADFAGLAYVREGRFRHRGRKPPEEWPTPAWIRVSAMDVNLANFWIESGRSPGLNGAVGVFGALATDSVEVVPPSSLRQGQ